MTRPKIFILETGWRTLLKDLGVQPADVLLRAGLSEDLLSRPQVGLSTAEYFQFWRSLEAAVGGPAFPLRLIDALTPEVFSPPLFAALCSLNLRLAALRLSHYKRLVAPMALDVSAAKQGALTLTPRWLSADAEPPTSVMVTELAFFVRLARLATREPIRAIQVALPTMPEPAQAYEQFFGVPVVKARTPSITFSAADADLPFLTANDAMWQVFEPTLRRRLAELDESATFSERVRSLLLKVLPSGQTSIETVSGGLALSKRTLQRRLSEEGVSFQSIVNQTREELARHYLSNTTLSHGEISFLLGFEDPNSFFRAFHEWTGCTPEALRQAAAQ